MGHKSRRTDRATPFSSPVFSVTKQLIENAGIFEFRPRSREEVSGQGSGASAGLALLDKLVETCFQSSLVRIGMRMKGADLRYQLSERRCALPYLHRLPVPHRLDNFVQPLLQVAHLCASRGGGVYFGVRTIANA